MRLAKRDHVDGGAAQISDQRGFVLPVVIICLLLMGLMTVAAMLTADDENRSAQAMHKASAAFYVAEAGLNEVFSKWSDYQAGIDSLMGGDSLVLDQATLPTGDTYQAVIYRWDEGPQPIYQLVVHSDHTRGSRRTLSYVVTSAPGGAGNGYTLGECCDATMTIRGELDLSSRAPSGLWKGEIDLSGLDTHPPGWEAADVCADEKFDKPAVVIEDSSLVKDDFPMTSSDCDAHPGNVCPVTLEGSPQPIVEDTSVTAGAFDQFGDLAWDSLKALADHTIGVWGTQEKLRGDDIYPRYNGDGTCDTSHPYNWGSDDPDDPCFNYFPIILVRGEIEFNKGWNPERAYGQGMLILDWNDATSAGTELELGREGEYRGIVLGKGCVEIQKGHQFYGAIYVDHTYDGPSCDAGGAFIDCRGHDSTSGGMCDNTTIQWSQCAVDRVLKNSSLVDFTEITQPGGTSGAQRLARRSFAELFQ
jgi:hypothetical protein